MGAWWYNPQSVDGRPPIEIPGNANLTAASAVTTREPGFALRSQTYQFPGLAGIGMTHFGAEPAVIACQARLEAVSQNARRAFEVLWNAYRIGGQYRLVDEYGRTYDGVQFVSYRPLDRERVLVSGAIVWDAEIALMWLRPTA